MPLHLFWGERTFTLTPRGDGKTEFALQEVFSGPLLPLIGRSLPDLNGTFAEFAAGLKRRAEAGSSADRQFAPSGAGLQVSHPRLLAPLR